MRQQGNSQSLIIDFGGEISWNLMAGPPLSVLSIVIIELALRIDFRHAQRTVAHDSDRRADRMMRDGMDLMNRGLLEQAEQLFSALIGARPDFAEAWNKRATVRFLRGDDAGSRSDIVRVIELEPRHFGALSGLGMIHMRAGDLQAALQAFEAALRVNPHLDQAVDLTARLRKRLRGQTL